VFLVEYDIFWMGLRAGYVFLRTGETSKNKTPKCWIS